MLSKIQRERLNALLSAARLDEAIAYLRSEGLSKGDSYLALGRAGMDWDAAKRAVHESPAWRDRHVADSEFHESLRRAVVALGQHPRLYQPVRLVADIPDAGLRKGTRGSIIDLNPADPQHVEVEFHLDLGRWAERIVPLSILELEAPTPVALFVERLVAEVPALQPLLSEHLDFNHELLAHVLFGDVTRFVVSGFAEHPERRGDAERILVLLEEALGSPDEDVQNLVSVSFCENLLGEEPLDAIRVAMGPTLRAELAKYEG